MSFKWCVPFLLLLVAGLPSQAWAKFTPEQVKAVYIYRIASFVYWNHEEQKTTINICAPDDEKVRALLVNITKDKVIRNKPLHVTDDQCDVLYISKVENIDLIQYDQANTLSISDLQSFTQQGGVIELATTSGRIKPKVNLDNIGEYTLSANFLRVADIEGGRQ